MSCDERDARPEDEAEDSIYFPTVIAEVLSPSTKRRDRTTTFDEYRTLPTLREYLLIERNAGSCISATRQLMAPGRSPCVRAMTPSICRVSASASPSRRCSTKSSYPGVGQVVMTPGDTSGKTEDTHHACQGGRDCGTLE